MNKRCKKCGSEFPATPEFFYRAKGPKDGLNGTCKTCWKIRVRKWESEHVDRVRELKMNWIDKNREQVYRTNNRWRRNNPDRVKALAKRQQLEKPDQIRQTHQAWRRANPARSALGCSRWRARRRNLADNFTIIDWNRAVEYWEGRCAYCGNPPGLFRNMRFHADHVIPLSDTECPGTVPGNIVPACGSCNCSKNDKRPLDWLTERFGKRKGNKVWKEIQKYLEWLNIAQPVAA